MLTSRAVHYFLIISLTIFLSTTNAAAIGGPPDCDQHRFKDVEQQIADKLEADPDDSSYKWWHLRFWHGMGVGTWAKLLWKNGIHNVDITKVPMAVSVSLLSLFNSVMARKDSGRFWKEVDPKQLDQPPLFILGHWRAGTTLLHELMDVDEQSIAPKMYQCFAPKTFMLATPEKRKMYAKLLPNRRPMDNMAMDYAEGAQECEFALLNAGAPSPYSFAAFPRRKLQEPMTSLDLSKLSEKDYQRWETELTRFYQRVAHGQTGRLLLKSPTHTGRLGELSKIFPGAKFLHISRNPEKLFLSTLHLWRTMFKIQRVGTNNRDEQALEEFVFRNLIDMYGAYERGRQELAKDSKLVEVRFEDLVKDPITVIEGAYRNLGVNLTDETKAAIAADWAARDNYKRNRYGTLTDDQKQQIRERWAYYYERFGYE